LPAPSGTDLIPEHLGIAITAEEAFERKIRSFLAAFEDDLDVRAVFVSHADDMKADRISLENRLAELGGRSEQSRNAFSDLAGIAATLGNASHVIEEEAVKNLITAYGLHASERAIAHALASLASAAGDEQTERLAEQFGARATERAERVFSFIRPRSKIAYNMLTPNELDPAVETKVADSRLV
jgi:ferritin-like metal-binding protein YciE